MRACSSKLIVFFGPFPQLNLLSTEVDTGTVVVGTVVTGFIVDGFVGLGTQVVVGWDAVVHDAVVVLGRVVVDDGISGVTQVGDVVLSGTHQVVFGGTHQTVLGGTHQGLVVLGWEVVVVGGGEVTLETGEGTEGILDGHIPGNPAIMPNGKPGFAAGKSDGICGCFVEQQTP